MRIPPFITLIKHALNGQEVMMPLVAKQTAPASEATETAEYTYTLMNIERQLERVQRDLTLIQRTLVSVLLTALLALVANALT